MSFAVLNPRYALCQLEPFDQFRKMAPHHRHVFENGLVVTAHCVLRELFTLGGVCIVPLGTHFYR